MYKSYFNAQHLNRNVLNIRVQNTRKELLYFRNSILKDKLSI